MKRYAVALVVLGVITSLVASVSAWLYQEGVIYFPSGEVATDFYMLLDSISKFSIVAAFYISLQERDVLKLIVFIVALFAFGEVMDEIFFNPYVMQLNEIILIIIATVYTLIWMKRTT